MQSEFEKALTHVHFRAEGDVEFRALLCACIPLACDAVPYMCMHLMNNCCMLPCESRAWISPTVPLQGELPLLIAPDECLGRTPPAQVHP